MKKQIGFGAALGLLPLLLTGCGSGEKGDNLTAVYGIMAALALALLVFYCLSATKKDTWFLVLFISIFLVNGSYLALAVSQSQTAALAANRLAYLGSVFLPLSMWMIIARVSRISYPKWLPWVLIGISVAVFLIAASYPVLTLYYQHVTFEKIDGVTVLSKNYGPLHSLYFVYLLGYFGTMIVTIIYATLRDKIESTAYAAILAIAVFVNIIVWAIEQMVSIDFEILSISYVISESFLLGLRFLMAETEKHKQASPPATPSPVMAEPVEADRLAMFRESLAQLTPKEREIYDCYLAAMPTAEIMEKLSIKENTLKFHNKNLYSKLGVSSRKQLLQFAAMLPRQ